MAVKKISVDSNSVYGGYAAELSQYNKKHQEIVDLIRVTQNWSENLRLQSRHSEHVEEEKKLADLRETLSALDGAWKERGRVLLASEVENQKPVADDLREKIDGLDQAILENFNCAWFAMLERAKLNRELSEFWNRCNNSVKKYALSGGGYLNEPQFRSCWGAEIPGGQQPSRVAMQEYLLHFLGKANQDGVSYEDFKKK